MSELTTDDGSPPSWEAISRHIAEYEFEQRQKFLGELSEDDRRKLFEATPKETLDAWVKEEEEDFKAAHGGTEVEGAEFAQSPDETVKIDGAAEPQDRDPDADPGVIELLVKEKLELASKLSEAQQEVDRYYERFGPLPPQTI